MMPGKRIPMLAMAGAGVAALLAVALLLTIADSQAGPSPEELRAIGLDRLLPATLPLDVSSGDATRSRQREELGRLLFFDHRMSGDGTMSCASCHIPDRGWGDGLALSAGYPGSQHWRNTQTVINSAHMLKLFWAGEALSLEAQAKSAWTGNLGQNANPAMLEERLALIPEYVRLFDEAFGDPKPSFDNALRAIASFESTINSRNVPFDQYMAGKKNAMTDKALRGLQLFTGKAGCIRCHSGPLFTDQSFHNTAVPDNSQFETDPLRQITLRFQHRARGVSEEVYRTADRDYGLYYTTKEDSDRGRFRTAPLRELGQTAPYMHNGVFDTLDEVVLFYNVGGGNDDNRSDMLRPLGLTGEEVANVVAFLESLTGDEIIIDPPEMPDYAVLP